MQAAALLARAVVRARAGGAGTHMQHASMAQAPRVGAHGRVYCAVVCPFLAGRSGRSSHQHARLRAAHTVAGYKFDQFSELALSVVAINHQRDQLLRTTGIELRPS